MGSKPVSRAGGEVRAGVAISSLPFSLLPLLSLGCAGFVWLWLGKGQPQDHSLPLPFHLTTRDSALLPLGHTVKERQDRGSGMGREVQVGFPRVSHVFFSDSGVGCE